MALRLTNHTMILSDLPLLDAKRPGMLWDYETVIVSGRFPLEIELFNSSLFHHTAQSQYHCKKTFQVTKLALDRLLNRNCLIISGMSIHSICTISKINYLVDA